MRGHKRRFKEKWKKLWIALVAALVVTLVSGVWMYTEAIAQEEEGIGTVVQRWRIVHRGLAQVILFSEEQIILQRRNEEEYTLSITEATYFKDIKNQDLMN